MTIKDDLREYIDKELDPTLAGFISKYNWNLTKEYISDNKIFSDEVRRLKYKQEAFLTSQYKNSTMAIFRLKQPVFGYTDTPQVSLGVNVSFTNKIPRPKRIKTDSITEVEG